MAYEPEEKFTILDWLRCFTWLDKNPNAAAFELRRMIQCEYCPFAMNRKKRICFKDDDLWCKDWKNKVKQRIRDKGGCGIELERIDKLCECRRQKCYDQLLEFLTCECDTEAIKGLLP